MATVLRRQFQSNIDPDVPVFFDPKGNRLQRVLAWAGILMLIVMGIAAWGIAEQLAPLWHTTQNTSAIALRKQKLPKTSNESFGF